MLFTQEQGFALFYSDPVQMFPKTNTYSFPEKGGKVTWAKTNVVGNNF